MKQFIEIDFTSKLDEWSWKLLELCFRKLREEREYSMGYMGYMELDKKGFATSKVVEAYRKLNPNLSGNQCITRMKKAAGMLKEITVTDGDGNTDTLFGVIGLHKVDCVYFLITKPVAQILNRNQDAWKRAIADRAKKLTVEQNTTES